MAWQKGSTTSIMLGFEGSATYGTAATVGYVMPINFGESLVGTQSINSVNTIRGNRNPNQGFRGARSVAGQITVPVDSVCLPYWLAAIFGDPTTTGAQSPYVHEYKIANTQPSFTLEKAFTDLDTDRYLRFLGCKAGGFALEVGGDGELVMTIDIAGAQDSWGTTAFHAAPSSPALTRINMFQGAVLEGGSSSTIITRASVNVNLGLDTRPETISIGSSGIRTDMAEGSVTVSGSVTALFTDAGYTLLAKGVAGTESSLKLTFTGSSTSVFELELQELEYGRPGVPISTPEGMLIELPFTGHYENGTEASVIVARISNATSSYNLVT